MQAEKVVNHIVNWLKDYAKKVVENKNPAAFGC